MFTNAPQLKRSQKTDFTMNMMMQGPPAFLSRERSFVKSNKDSMKRRSQTMATIKAGKPAMEIYRPPNSRSDMPMSGKLNVHAKEFKMNDINPSRSSGNIHAAMGFEPMPLQHSKSSGNILRHVSHPGYIPFLPHQMAMAPLIHSASAAQIYGSMPSTSYHQFSPEIINPHPVFSGTNQPHNIFHQNNNQNWTFNSHHHSKEKERNPLSNSQSHSSIGSLKRSKSLGASDALSLANKLRDILIEDIDFTVFPEAHQATLKQAAKDPNQLSSRALMDIVKVLMEKAIEGIKYSEPISKLCTTIIKEEKNQTFLESLLNTCQQWYQERDKMLRGIRAGDGTRFTAFMWFLTELYGQLKRQQISEQVESLQPELVLLTVLAKCCQACVTPPIRCASETECLFFVLTSIGRDMEAEIPQQLEELLTGVRDGFLANTCTTAVRKTLLQLIELHASNWQLPGSSVLYYYPRIK